MSAAAANRIRLALERTRANFPADQLDAFTSSTPRAPFGRIWDFELGLFNNTVLDPTTAYQTITLEIKAANSGVINAGSAALLSRTVASPFNGALTRDQWDNDQGVPSYHAVVEFTDAETATLDMALATNNELPFGFVVTALTASGRITLGSGLLIVVKDGGTGAGAGTAPVPTYTLSDQDILAALASKVSLADNPNGAFIVLRDGATGRGIRLSAVVDAAGGGARLDIQQIP